MPKGWIIFIHELYTVFARPSYWIAVLFLPAASLCFFAGVNWITHSQGAGESLLSEQMETLANPKEDTRPQGYVDQAGIVRLFPAGFDREELLAYPDELSARRALSAGTISAYFLISPGYLKTGLIYYNFEGLNPTIALRSNALFKSLIRYNLVDGDREAAGWVSEPVTEIRENDLSPNQGEFLINLHDGMNQDAVRLPMLIEMLVAFEVMGVSGLLLTAINREQENRILEILLTSSSAYPFLLAKMGALGLAGLVQMVTWAVNALIMAQWGGQAFSIPELANFSPGVLLWVLALCIAGYLFFAALMISVGVLVSGVRDYSTVASVVVLPLLFPMMMIFTLAREPNGPLALLMSFLPFTSLTTLAARMVIVRVPAWQPALALALLAASALLALRLTAHLFQSQRLLGGSAFYISNWFKFLKREKEDARAD